MVTTKLCGTHEGTDVKEFTITDGRLSVNIMEYGATLHNIFFDGVDCVCGYDTLDGYKTGDSHQGATVGRFANRIDGGKFSLNGKEYQLELNNGTNTLHGGFVGFSHRLYKGEIVGDSAVKFTMHSPDGEGGYPANLDMSVTFSVANDTLSLNYEAFADADTHVNFTNHAYFNLGSPDCLNTELTIKSDKVTVSRPDLIPTGEFRDVAGTPFDFRTAKPIGKDVRADDFMIKIGGGYDHNYVLGAEHTYKKDCVTAYCPESGITMKMSTDLPGVQLYTSCCLDEPMGKNGKPLSRFLGFCLETQYYPDTPNHPDFPQSLIKANEKFTSVTEYSFSK